MGRKGRNLQGASISSQQTGWNLAKSCVDFAKLLSGTMSGDMEDCPILRRLLEAPNNPPVKSNQSQPLPDWSRPIPNQYHHKKFDSPTKCYSPSSPSNSPSSSPGHEPRRQCRSLETFELRSGRGQ